MFTGDRRFLPDWMQYQMDDLPPGVQPVDGGSQPNLPPDLPPSDIASAYPNPADYTGYTGTPADLSPPSTITSPPPPSFAPVAAAATSTAMLSPEERAKAELAPYASVDKYGDLRYPRRTKLQVIGDIGKGALLGGIPGAIAGGVGLYRQQALNQRVAEATQSEAAKDQYKAAQEAARLKQAQYQSLEDYRKSEGERKRQADISRDTVNKARADFFNKRPQLMQEGLNIRSRSERDRWITEQQKQAQDYMNRIDTGDPTKDAEERGKMQSLMDELTRLRTQPTQEELQGKPGTPPAATTAQPPGVPSPSTPPQAPSFAEAAADSRINPKGHQKPNVKFTNKGVMEVTGSAGNAQVKPVQGGQDLTPYRAPKTGGKAKPGVIHERRNYREGRRTVTYDVEVDTNTKKDISAAPVEGGIPDESQRKYNK